MRRRRFCLRLSLLATMTPLSLKSLQHPDESHRKRAVEALAASKDPRAAGVLMRVMREDPSAAVRAIATDGLKRLMHQRDPLGMDTAVRLLDEAEWHAQSGSSAQAARTLQRALEADPTLPEGDYAAQVARIKESVRAQHNTALAGWRQRRSRSRTSLKVISVAVIVVMFFSLIPALLRELHRQSSGLSRVAVHRINDVEYYVIPPSSPAPEGGYPLLVALPGTQTISTELVPYFVQFSDQAGVLVVVPEYTAAVDSIAPTVQIDGVINDVRGKFTVDARGAVLFGLDLGGDVATQYAHDYYGVIGVIAAGAAKPSLPPEGDTSIRYLMLYPVEGALTAEIQPRLEAMQAQGSEVRFRIVDTPQSQMSQEIAAYVIDFTREMFRVGE